MQASTHPLSSLNFLRMINEKYIFFAYINNKSSFLCGEIRLTLLIFEKYQSQIKGINQPRASKFSKTFKFIVVYYLSLKHEKVLVLVLL